jgi:hypothetical protein
MWVSDNVEERGTESSSCCVGASDTMMLKVSETSRIRCAPVRLEMGHMHLQQRLGFCLLLGESTADE